MSISGMPVKKDSVQDVTALVDIREEERSHSNDLSTLSNQEKSKLNPKQAEERK